MKKTIGYALAHMAAELASFVAGYGIYYSLTQIFAISATVAFVIAAVVTLALWFASFFFLIFSSSK